MKDNELTFDSLIAVSPVYKQVIQKAKKYANTDATILLTGNTGTGKSFLSKVIHNESKRRKAQFVHINCANLSSELLESTLFGHERGSFTGADRKKLGSLELANHGTVFLDEIGDISNKIQTKLLRVLEDRSFERVGGKETLHVDIRIIAATNRSLIDLINEGKFREDLFYRLSVLPLHIPDLCARKGCIAGLARSVLYDVSTKYHKSLLFTSESIKKLQEYHWPGNIRQLYNIIERAVILCDEAYISKEMLEIPSKIKITNDAT